ncbi:hypothetical protein [Pontibacter arcticus]|uniref:Uncharacterized protein n=1 Tax=Pontibacter arcticus TaxID=2080288 RepID=A0A364RB62_9BACT|nr:hypothetical protein [Pontibacter arcticus]RAU81568.1 hypothetical protein DP923_15820 [Pontibacter arcticus]
MKFNPKSKSHTLAISLNTMWVAMVALGCAFFVQTQPLNFTYPIEIVLKGIVKDAPILYLTATSTK